VFQPLLLRNSATTILNNLDIGYMLILPLNDCELQSEASIHIRYKILGLSERRLYKIPVILCLTYH
jgi:hypothetical protein